MLLGGLDGSHSLDYALESIGHTNYNNNNNNVHKNNIRECVLPVFYVPGTEIKTMTLSHEIQQYISSKY